MKHLTKTLSALILCIFALTACQASDNASSNLYQEKAEQSVSPTASASPAPTPSPKRQSPFDAFYINDDASALMDRAQDILVTKCMKEKGFTDYEQTTVSAQSEEYIEASNFVDLWGIFDLESAKKYGYTTKDASFVDEKGKEWHFDGEKYYDYIEWLKKYRSESNIDTFTDAQKKEYATYSECDEKMADEFYAILDVNADRSNNTGELQNSANEAAKADSRMTSLVQKWSECMKEKGHNFSNSIEAYEKTFDMNDDRNMDSPRKKAEIAIATADVTCKTDLNFRDTWYDILYEHQNRIIQENLPIFEEEKAYSNSLQKRAEDIIKEYG
jgi:hypothetical protein